MYILSYHEEPQSPSRTIGITAAAELQRGGNGRRCMLGTGTARRAKSATTSPLSAACAMEEGPMRSCPRPASRPVPGPGHSEHTGTVAETAAMHHECRSTHRLWLRGCHRAPCGQCHCLGIGGRLSERGGTERSGGPKRIEEPGRSR